MKRILFILALMGVALAVSAQKQDSVNVTPITSLSQIGEVASADLMIILADGDTVFTKVTAAQLKEYITPIPLPSVGGTNGFCLKYNSSTEMFIYGDCGTSGGDTINISNQNLAQSDSLRIYNAQDQTFAFENLKSIQFSFGQRFFQEPFLIEYHDNGTLLDSFGASNHYLLRSQLELESGSDNPNRVAAVLGQSVINSTSMTDVVGVYGNVKNESASVTTQRAGYFANVTNGTGNANSSIGVDIQVTNTGTDTVTNAKAINISGAFTGITDNFTGFHMNPITGDSASIIQGIVIDEPKARSWSRGNLILGSSYGEGETKLIVKDETNDPVKIIGLQSDLSPDSLLSIDNQGFLKVSPYPSSGGVSYTNGIQDIGGSGGLGGGLSQSTSINTNGYDVDFSGSGGIGVGVAPGSTRFRVEGEVNNIALYSRGSSTSFNNYLINNSSGGALYVQNTSSGPGAYFDVKKSFAQDIIYREGDSTALNTYENVLISTLGTASNGFGGQVLFNLERPSGASTEASGYSFEWVDTANLVSEFSFNSRDAGSGLTKHLRLQGSASGGEKLAIFTGNVGIDNTAPVFALDVTGAIQASDSILVNGAKINVPDYVFSEDYDRPSIEEHGQEMLSNKHLPAAKGAQYINQGQYNLVKGAMAHREELELAHLYILELYEKIKQLERKINRIEKR